MCLSMTLYMCVHVRCMVYILNSVNTIRMTKSQPCDQNTSNVAYIAMEYLPIFPCSLPKPKMTSLRLSPSLLHLPPPNSCSHPNHNSRPYSRNKHRQPRTWISSEEPWRTHNLRRP